jgi:hypothetical protein
MFRVVIMLLVLVLSFSLAQDSTAPDITALRQEALQLTLEVKISELPAELQTEARELLNRAEALREPVLAMRARMLEAYIAELEAGKEPYLARAIARNTVAEERLALLREVVPLVRDIRVFVRENPEVAPLFKELRAHFRENGFQDFR